MVQCPKCKRLTLPETRICPNCGEPLPLLPELAADRVQEIARQRPMSGPIDYAAWGGGFVVGLLSPALFLIGYFIFVAVYFLSKERKTSPFMRGMGIGLLLATLLLVGAFALCLYAIVAPGPHGVHS